MQYPALLLALLVLIVKEYMSIWSELPAWNLGSQVYENAEGCQALHNSWSKKLGL